jgi:class 3 adenylate cyclase
MSNEETPPNVASHRRSDGRSRAGERRQATVLFADLVGFTAFSERQGEEGAYSLMQGISELMTDAIHSHSGTVKSFTGDGVMALFGVPAALEDAPLRACRAALDIQRRIGSQAVAIEAKYGLRPQMRIGINTGPMIVGEVNSGDSTGITAIGDTVNLAARLQALAEPGGVVVSEATHRLVQGLVDVQPAGEHEVKGKSEKQKIYRLDAIRDGARRFDRSISMGLTAYVGRARELEVLDRGLEFAAQGVRVIDVVGEPGIGKSRLVHEFLARIADQGAFVLSGNCTPDGQQTPFLPFIEIVRGSFRVSEGEAESEITRKLDRGLSTLGLASEQNVGLLLNLLGLKPPERALEGLDGVLIGLRTRDLFLHLLQERCRLTPVVMVFEDLHWIDSASEEVLGRVIASEEKLPLLVVQTHRPEYRAPWADRPRVSALELEPLTTADTSQVVCDRLGVADLPTTLARLVAKKAEGNPLFAEEIAGYLVERGVVRRAATGIEYDAEAVAAALPASIEALLSARVDRLAPKDRALLQAASVIGRRFGRDLLAAVAPLDDIDVRLSAIQALDLLIHPDAASEEFVFKHALVRDALYNSLLHQPRSALHLAIAMEIEQRSHNRVTEVAEVLAHHYAHTDRVDKRFTYLVMAGEKSLGIYSLSDAEQYFQQALSLIESNPDCSDNAGLIEVLAHLSNVLMIVFQPGQVVSLIERHRLRIDSSASGDLSASVIVLANYAFAAGMMCRFRSGLVAAKQALDMALRLGDDRSKAYARGALVLASGALGEGDSEEIQRNARLAIQEGDRTNDGNLHSWARLTAAWDFLGRGLTDRGRALALELQERGRARGDPRAAAMGLWILGWHDIFDEKYEDALVHGSECIRISLTPFDREIGAQVRGVALIASGNVAEGADLLIDHRHRAIANDFLYCKTGTDGPVGIAMVLQGDLSGGSRFIEWAIKRHDQAGNVIGRDFSRIFLAEIYIEFLAPKEKAPLSVIVKHLPFLIATALTGWKKAEKMLLQARENPMFSSVSHHRARIDANLGILYKIAKRGDEARRYLTQARVIAESLDAKALLAKIDSALAGRA